MTISPPRSGLVALDYFGVVVYLMATVAIIVWSYRRKTDSEDFFLGSRRMPWLAVGMSLLATLLSTNSYLGVPGEIIKNGIAMFAGYLAVPLSMGVVLLVWVPFFMRLKLTSAYEYLERRFDYRVRLLAGMLFFFLRLGWISVVTYTASMALSRMTGQPISMVIMVVGTAATIYTCVGGIRAVIWNDVLQFVMLFGGTFVTIGYVMWATGTGPSEWWHGISQTASRKTSPIIFSWDITVRMTIVTAMVHTFFWTICTHGSDQVVLQRYFSTESLAAARRSYIVNAISDMSVGLLLALSGLALHYFYLQEGAVLPGNLNLDKGDEVLPYFFAHQLPAGFGGLILAGFLCDAMQTLVSGVNSITAVATQDVFQRLFPAGKRIMKEMTLARIVTVFMGLLVTSLALFNAQHVEQSGRNIIDLMPRMFNLFLGPLASVFLIGMFLPRCTARSTIPAVILGLLLAIVWSWWGELPWLIAKLGRPDAARQMLGVLGVDFVFAPKVPPLTALDLWRVPLDIKPKTPTITLTIALPYLSSFLLAAIFGILFDRRGDHPGRQYTWLAVMRRKSENAEPSP